MDQYRANAQPKKFGLWIYSGDENNDGVSDNYNCMMTAQFIANDGTWVDESGVTHYDGADGGSQMSKSIKITPDEHMNWIGWKYFEFDVPEDWPMPITCNYLWMSNIYKGADQADYRTTIMMDDLKWIYTDEAQDLTGPDFSETMPASSGLFTSTLDFSTVISDESGVNESSITVTCNDEAVTCLLYTSSPRPPRHTARLSRACSLTGVISPPIWSRIPRRWRPSSTTLISSSPIRRSL